MDAVVAPRKRSSPQEGEQADTSARRTECDEAMEEEEEAAAAPPEGNFVYTEYDYKFIKEAAGKVQEYKADLEAKFAAETGEQITESTLKRKVNEFCAANGHSVSQGVPFFSHGLKGVGDPLHSDSNDLKQKIDNINDCCCLLDEKNGTHGRSRDEDKEDAPGNAVVGPLQEELLLAMKSLGLGPEAERLREQKTGKKGAAPVKFRLTGSKAVDVLRGFPVLTDVLDVGAEESEFERLRRGMLVLSFLYMRAISTLYSKFSVTKEEVENLVQLGRDYMALICLFGLKCGANEHNICYGIPTRLQKFFELVKIDGEKALGGGVIGSTQGLEGKHWFTKLAMLLNTSGRLGDCWYEYLWNERFRMYWGERHVPQRVGYANARTCRPRIPDVYEDRKRKRRQAEEEHQRVCV